MEIGFRRTGAARKIAVVARVIATMLGASAAGVPPREEGPQDQQVEVLSESDVKAFGLPPVSSREQWVQLKEEVRTETTFDARLGRNVTAPGTYREFAVVSDTADALSVQSVVAAAGCTVSTHLSAPHRVYYSTAHKYGPRAYAWAQVSSGCAYSKNVYVQMREIQPILQPRVGSGSITAAPGAGRKTAYAYYSGLTRCENYVSYAFQEQSGRVRVCP